MKVRDTHILFLPDRAEPSPGLWQWRWRQKLSTGRFVMPREGEAGVAADEVAAAVNASDRPAVLVGHGRGIVAALAALPDYRQRVAGAFFAAPPRPRADPSVDASDQDWPAHAGARLPFPAMLVASRNDPACGYDEAGKLAEDWGAMLLDAGEAGHIDEEAGYGPWPEGSMAFAQFLRKLD